jgi:peptidoglycan/LPS O-acetylase OafA/YrhL
MTTLTTPRARTTSLDGGASRGLTLPTARGVAQLTHELPEIHLNGAGLPTRDTRPSSAPSSSRCLDTSSLYYPALDSLRFVAFLLVLIHHSRVPAGRLYHYGWIGVDLFLCLSAFLFARLLSAEYQNTGRIHVGSFYLRRALRIWPLYFVFLSAALTYSVYAVGWHEMTLVRLLGMLTFTDNLLCMAWAYNGLILYTGHLWSISYEEQFYFVVPWALRVCHRLSKAQIWYGLSAILLLGMAVRAFFIYYQVGHPAIYVCPLTHFEAVIGGLVLGLNLTDGFLRRAPSWAWLVLGVAALVVVTRLPKIYHKRWELMIY